MLHLAQGYMTLAQTDISQRDMLFKSAEGLFYNILDIYHQNHDALDGLFWLQYARATIQKRSGNDRVARYFFEEALDIAQQQIEADPEWKAPIYNSACLLNKLGQTDKALAVLGTVDKNYLRMATTDPDFQNLRDEPRFHQLVNQKQYK